MNNRLVISSTIGFMCIGLTAWMHGLGLTHWVAGPNMHLIMLFTLGTVVLGVMAILSFFHGRTLEAVIFFGFAGLAFTEVHLSGMGQMGARGYSSGTLGWFGLIWAVFFFYVWLGSFKAGWARSLFLLALWLAILAACLRNWIGWEGFSYINGYLVLFTGLVATYISAAEIVNHGCGKMVLKTGMKDGA